MKKWENSATINVLLANERHRMKRFFMLHSTKHEKMLPTVGVFCMLVFSYRYRSNFDAPCCEKMNLENLQIEENQTKILTHVLFSFRYANIALISTFSVFIFIFSSHFHAYVCVCFSFSWEMHRMNEMYIATNFPSIFRFFADYLSAFSICFWNSIAL